MIEFCHEENIYAAHRRSRRHPHRSKLDPVGPLQTGPPPAGQTSFRIVFGALQERGLDYSGSVSLSDGKVVSMSRRGASSAETPCKAAANGS